ncbi:MAG: hypothetical protein R2684_13525 [Pyrinomonadaceae bacterium]
MNFKLVFSSISLTLFVISLITTGSTFVYGFRPSISNPGSSDEKKISLNLENVTVFGAVREILDQNNSLMAGVEMAPGNPDSIRFDVKLSNLTVSEALRVVLSNAPTYDCDLQGDRVLIVPKERDPGLSELLDLRISKISYPKENSSVAVLRELMKTPEINLFLNSRDLAYSDWLGIPSKGELFPASRTGSLAIDKSVEDILFEILLESGRKMWQISFSGPKSKHVVIKF